MLKFWAIGSLYSVLALATPPIEGGKDVPLSSFEYVDVVRLNLPNGGTCTATKVSPTMILTAAHCVSVYENNQLTHFFKTGGHLNEQGKIVKVAVHPNYLGALKAKARQQITLYDIAFIEVEPKASRRVMEYPKIISKDTKLGSRKKLKLAGHGSTHSYWNGKTFDYKSTKSSLQIADNSWNKCPLNYFDDAINALDKFNQNLTAHLQIKATRVHTIQNGNETFTTDGVGMVLPGDSGSPALERDEENKLIVTGVASNIVSFGDGSGHARFIIEVDGKELTNTELADMPENWGLAHKSDTDFPQIQNILKENNLLDAVGLPKPNVMIKRQYTRITEGNFADLAHPDNQSFIKSMMKK